MLEDFQVDSLGVEGLGFLSGSIGLYRVYRASGLQGLGGLGADASGFRVWAQWGSEFRV